MEGTIAPRIHWAKLEAIDEFAASLGDDERPELARSREVAERFALSLGWPGMPRPTHVGLYQDGVVAVFLAEANPPPAEGVDFVWLIVGDVPPAYIVIDECPDAAGALDAYIEEMERWVSAVLVGKALDELIPVNAPPTCEWAERLRSRLVFLKTRILIDGDDDPP